MTFDALKRLFWPHTIGALAIIVLVDYLTIVATLVQIVAFAWLMMQLAALPLGFAAAATSVFSERSVYRDLFGYRIVRFFPLLTLGKTFFDHIMSELQPAARPEKELTSELGQDAGPSERRDDQGCPASV